MTKIVYHSFKMSFVLSRGKKCIVHANIAYRFGTYGSFFSTTGLKKIIINKKLNKKNYRTYCVFLYHYVFPCISEIYI